MLLCIVNAVMIGCEISEPEQKRTLIIKEPKWNTNAKLWILSHLYMQYMQSMMLFYQFCRLSIQCWYCVKTNGLIITLFDTGKCITLVFIAPLLLQNSKKNCLSRGV